MEEGLEMEQNRRWQEAVQHYEKAHRANRTAKEIDHRLQICRIHYDVVRRYNDVTFLSSIESMPQSKAMDLLHEVLGKLEQNYVDTIRLEDLMRNGTAFLEVALTEPDFIKTNIPNASPEKIENFRANIHKSVLGKPVKNRNDARTIVANVAALAHQHLGIPATATIHEYVAGSIGLLDPYSGLMTAGELTEVMSQIEGNLIGLGVELWAEDNDLQIIEVFEGSPAFDAGLRAGDKILQVGSAKTNDVSAKRAADLLRGPENSQVRLVVSRNEKSPFNVNVTRRRVVVKSVPTAEIADEKEHVGYLRITNFQKSTADEVDQALMKLYKKGMQSLIVDLRRNPGGLLDSSVEVADRFLRQGYIVTTRGRNGVENRNYSARDPQTWDIPLVVLIDGDSASASEIFAGAIRDHHRGMIVGQTSYGKGSVQGLFPTENRSRRLATHRFEILFPAWTCHCNARSKSRCGSR